MLGALNNDEVERYLRGASMRARTDKTVTDPDAVLRLVLQARQEQVAALVRDGLALCDPHRDLGGDRGQSALHGRRGGLCCCEQV